MERTLQFLWNNNAVFPAQVFAIFDDGSLWWFSISMSDGVGGSLCYVFFRHASAFQIIQVPSGTVAGQPSEPGDYLMSYVLDGAGNLWFVGAQVQVDGSVERFQGLDDQTVVVLGTDGNLWQESGSWGTVPPPRVQVDASVKQFHQVPHTNDIFVLGTDGNLWLEQGPFGVVPPQRQQVDSTVAAFEALNVFDFVWVLGTDFKLWLEFWPFGNVPPRRILIDSNVQAFQPVDLNDVFVLKFDGTLWLEQGSSGTPVRTQIDANVIKFSAVDAQHVVVCGADRKLWLEKAPWGSVPPARFYVADLTQPPYYGLWR